MNRLLSGVIILGLAAIAAGAWLHRYEVTRMSDWEVCRLDRFTGRIEFVSFKAQHIGTYPDPYAGIAVETPAPPFDPFTSGQATPTAPHQKP